MRIEAYCKQREERILRSGSIKVFTLIYTRDQISSVTLIGPIRDLKDQLVTNDSDKATAFNNFFRSVFTTDDNKIPDFARRSDAHMALPSVIPNKVRAIPFVH